MSDLPSGWSLATLPEVASINPPQPEKIPDDSTLVSFVPMAAVETETGRLDLSAGRPWREVKKGYSRFQDGDVLFAKITPCMENGKVALATGLRGGAGAGSTEFHILRPGRALHPKYLMFALLQEQFRRHAKSRMTGTAGQLRVPASVLETHSFPLAPRSEQERIVRSIESCFSRLEETEELLEKVQRNLKRYRAAVLKAAVEGRLNSQAAMASTRTGPPRRPLSQPSPAPVPSRKRRAGRLWGSGTVPMLTDEERETLPAGWSWVKVRDLAPALADEVVQVGPMSMRSADFENGGVPVLNVGSIQWDRIDEGKVNFLPAKKAAQFIRYMVRAGDVLFTRSGTVGRTAVARQRHDGWLMTFHLLRARPDPRVCSPDYLRTVFEGASHIRRQTREASIGTTRAGFNTNLLADLDVPLPPVSEQARIIEEVERCLSQVDVVTQGVSEAREHSQRLRQAILRYAFEGRLVDQDPTDEPASALLERIRLETATMSAPGGRAVEKLRTGKGRIRSRRQEGCPDRSAHQDLGC